MEEQNIFIRNGCELLEEEFNSYTHPDLPFILSEDKGCLYLNINMEYRIDDGQIPLTDENSQNLIKAFNPK